tara:strand:- start:69 stop:1088 length:1020 start_codon:yes stop_codon:yes gene_type:complete
MVLGYIHRMKTNLILAFCLSIGMAFAPTFQAQETTSQTTTADKYVRIFLHNGGIYEGRVIEITTEHFLIETLLMGATKISKSQIATLTYIEQEQMGEMKSNNRSADINPQSSRYFFSPSAHALKQGEGYYHNIWLGYNSISYGITDDFTAGITMTPIGMGATAKYSYQLSDKVSTSAGGIGVLPFAEGDLGSAGIAFVNLTFGDERKNLSLNYGLAWYGSTRTIYIDAYTDDNGEYHPAYPHYGDDGTYYPMRYDEQGTYNAHMFNASGMFEVSSRIWILFETYFIFDLQTEDSAPINATVMGVRSASRKRDALWDWGMVALPSEGVFGIPWIACTVPF